jgi:hypothetical protein
LTPDRGVQVFVHVSPALLSSTNQVLTVSPQTRNPAISSVTKLWKPDPKYAAKSKGYTTGYTLRLELGQVNELGSVSGKIFLALPDLEQSVVAGVFKASANLTGLPAAVAPAPVPAMGGRYGTQPAADRRTRQR